MFNKFMKEVNAEAALHSSTSDDVPTSSQTIAKPRVGGSTVEKSTLCQNLGDVYKDINAIKIEATDSFDTLVKKFYAVMTKHGICQGNWSGNGRTVATPEWCMCWHNFKSNIEARFNWIYLMSEPPKHLLAYGKKPKMRV